MDPLVERAKRGDREATAELVRRSYDAVYRFCARRVGTESAKDVAQETFLTACRSLRRYAGRSSFEVWLFGIAHNLCRKAKRSPTPVSPTDAWRCEPTTEESWLDRRALVEALGSLSGEHLEVVLLHEVEGLTYEEAAQVLGVPAGTVKSRLHHAFAKLRASLQAQGVTR